MKKKNITIKTLSELTNISEATLKRLRTRDSNPTIDVLIKLAKNLDVTLNELIGRMPSDVKTYYQGDSLILEECKKECIFIFKKQTFNFRPGAKAIFRIYTGKEELTKYLLDKNGSVMKKVSSDPLIIENTEHKLYEIDKKDIIAYIIKQLYEVNYA